ncbi:accessory gene regulator B family protein [Macrococcoides caseolyticum]|uniref:accessory gene regulator B family protein n=1 Tax=Macrococcoides caseolyticum TaxID=69966 RepID=UPI001F45BB87|nr:accessory gene regulator B family protein [Macrococcus caseolyticus]MCE4956619.1 accessory gene regulator B family protein [Macrococcus caseolyticus]
MTNKPYNHLSELDRLKFNRGLQVIRKNLFISFAIYFTSFCLSILFQVFVIHMCYFMIRYFSFGAHIKNFYLCVLQSLITFVLLPYCIIHYFPNVQLLIPGIIAALIIIIIGPQPTKAQPIHDYMLKPLHIKTVITVILFVALALFSHEEYGTLIFYGIITQSITLIITYMRRKYHA